jgi:hypothetical protein
MIFRPGDAPPLRGTFMTLAPSEHMIYTKGSINRAVGESLCCELVVRLACDPERQLRAAYPTGQAKLSHSRG